MKHWICDYLGRGYEVGASGPEAYDCYGLVRAVYRDRLGIDLTIPEGISAATPIALRRAMAAAVGWREVPFAEAPELAVVSMSHGRHPHHVGLWVAGDGGRVLHAVRDHGVTAASCSSLRLGGWNLVAAMVRP